MGRSTKVDDSNLVGSLTQSSQSLPCLGGEQACCLRLKGAAEGVKDGTLVLFIVQRNNKKLRGRLRVRACVHDGPLNNNDVRSGACDRKFESPAPACGPLSYPHRTCRHSPSIVPIDPPADGKRMEQRRFAPAV